MIDFIEATIDIGYFDGRPARTEVAAKVAMDKRGMTLAVTEEQGEDILWHGERRGQGHYLLSAPDAGMEASFHRFAESTILEGFWRKGPERGFWRLHLPVDAMATLQAAIKKPPSAADRAPARPVRRRRPRLVA